MVAPRIYIVADLKAQPPPTPEEYPGVAHVWLELIAAREAIRATAGLYSESDLDSLLDRDDDEPSTSVAPK